jgi:hypothetical protein
LKERKTFFYRQFLNPKKTSFGGRMEGGSSYLN